MALLLLVFGPDFGGLLTVTVVPSLPLTKPYVAATDCASVVKRLLFSPAVRALAARKAAASAALCIERCAHTRSDLDSEPGKTKHPRGDKPDQDRCDASAVGDEASWQSREQRSAIIASDPPVPNEDA